MKTLLNVTKVFFFLVTASVNPTTCMTIADTSPISLMFQRYNEKKKQFEYKHDIIKEINQKFTRCTITFD